MESDQYAPITLPFFSNKGNVESKITENEEDHTDQADSSTSTTPESPGETDGAIASNSGEFS